MPVFLAYIAVVLIWATTPLAIQWSGQVDWFFGLAARVLISAILIIPILVWFTKTPFSFKTQDLKVYFFASLGMIGGMTPIYYAAQTMPSGWISLIFGLTPILTGLFAWWLLKGFRLTWFKLTGILLGFLGLVVVFAPNLSWEAEQLILGMLLALLGGSFHSLSTVLVKKYNRHLPNSHVVAGMVWISSAVFLIAHPQYLSLWPTMTNQALAAIFYLGVFGSLIGFILYYYVLTKMDAVRIGLITLITPVMALLLGYFFNDEPLTPMIWLGAALVILGLVMFEFGDKGSKNFLQLISGPK